MTRTPDFENLAAVLRREAPSRPTLFEFFLNQPLYEKLARPTFGNAPRQTREDEIRFLVHAFANAGYDYATITSVVAGLLDFPRGERSHAASVSLNDGGLIEDDESFEAYPWPDMTQYDYSILERIEPDLLDGQKLILSGPGGVLENVIDLVGYEDLCFLIADEPELVDEIFSAVGSRLVEYYRNVCQFSSVGAAISNDDWGFKTQTMLSPADMRRYVFPWHKRIVEAIHAGGKPAILHSCGYFGDILEDVIEKMKYDGRHSYEDTIMPVEDAYRDHGKRVAILGGIDLDFLCRSTPDAIAARAQNLLEISETSGSYALGSGNSIPEYVPDENYFAMISVIDAPACC